MSANSILTNEFNVRYDEADEVLLISMVHDGRRMQFPIRLTIETLKEMGSEKASRWVGETILLLIPSMRTQLFKLPEEPSEH